MGQRKEQIDQCLNDIKKYEKWENCVQDKIGGIYLTLMPL